MNNNRCCLIIGLSLVAGLIFIMFVSMLSLYTNIKVQQNQYGVIWNNYTMTFSDLTVHEQGTYTLPIGAIMLLFPRTPQYIDITSRGCFSRDKIQLNLTYSIQYQINKDTLITIVLQQFNDLYFYTKYIADFATAIIINTCGQYTAEQYYDQRAIIDNDMYNNLTSAFNISDTGSSIVSFQLTDIEFPTDFSNVITLKQTTQQQISTAINQRVNDLTQANTTYMVSLQNAQILIIQANLNSMVILNQANANVTAITTLWYLRTNTYSIYSSITNSDQYGLLQYCYSQYMSNNHVSTVFV